MKKKQSFLSFVNADSVTYECPCGMSVNGEGTIINVFIKKHYKHTDGYVEQTITSDGARFIRPPAKQPRRFKQKHR